MTFGKRLPGIFSISEKENGIKIYRIGGDEQLTDYAPKWLQPVCGVTWAFGDKLAMFSEKSEGNIREYSIVKSDEVVKQSLNEFEATYKSGISKGQWC